jgi:hypothetical protein
MKSEFEKKSSELLGSDDDFDFLGIEQMAQFHIRAGVSSLASWMAFPNKLDEEGFDNLPDYIHSENLEKDLDFKISFCVHSLVKTKYFPNNTEAWVMIGGPSGSSERRVQITGWEDYQIVNFEGDPLYTKEILSEAGALGDAPLTTALSLIVKDICDDGRIMSEDWYRARMVLEYFRECPVPPENAFLIGMLHKELCVKQAYEVDLSNYYKKLTEADVARRRGTDTTREKGLELRVFSVQLFVDLVEEAGPLLSFASPIEQARALRKAAISQRPADFMRDGKPLSEQWFLKNIIEDRKAEIVAKLAHSHRPKKA